MPQKRNSNAAKGKAKVGSGARGTMTPSRASLQNDVVGIALAFFAIAMLVSLVFPSGAVITHAVERGLTLCFGVGAIICPITLFLFSLTFFVEGEEPFGGRAALGLLMVSLSILSLISLFCPGAEEDPSLVLDQGMLEDLGGYVGGGVAWLLLSMVGKAVGYGYRKIGFVLDRGYFSKENIEHLEKNEYSFVMMLKGKADLVQKWVLENRGSFEEKRLYNIQCK